MASVDDLKRQVLFEDIDRADLEKLSKVVMEISLKKGDCLFRESDETKGIYLVKKGKVEISKLTQDGWKQTLTMLAQGNFFGELSIMEKRRHEANAIGVENSELFLLSKEDFEKMEKENPILALMIMKKIATVMSKNLRGMNEKFLKALINY